MMVPANAMAHFNLRRSSKAKRGGICFPLLSDYPFLPLTLHALFCFLPIFFSLLIFNSACVILSLPSLRFEDCRSGSACSRSMELLLELFITASLALILSFLVAKLVSMAMDGDADRELEVNLGILGEKLTVQAFDSDKKVDFVELSAETIDKFPGESSEVGQTVETESFHSEIPEKQCEFPQVSSCGGVEKNFEGDLLPENVYEGSMENINNSKTEGSGPYVDNTVIHRLYEGIDEVVKDKTTNDVFPSTTEDADHEEDDDDWEGIERTELENVFAAALRFVDEEDSLPSAWSELEMEFYGLHKVATEGPCREPPPMALKVSARAKWNAWQKLGNMSPEVAMEQYVTLLSEKAPGWLQHYSTRCIKPGSLDTAEGDYLQHQPDSASLRKLEELTSAGKTSNVPTDYDLVNMDK